jgi:hypothetical protein
LEIARNFLSQLGDPSGNGFTGKQYLEFGH